MTIKRYTVEQIETQGVSCQFHSMGGLRDGWIMPDGYGVVYAGYAQLRFDADTITTDNREGLVLARIAVANKRFDYTDFGTKPMSCEDWLVEDNDLVKVCTTRDEDALTQIEFRVTFKPNAAESTSSRIFNLTQGLAEIDDAWEPSFTPWRHGGWIVSNLQTANGGLGCVSNNYPDSQWRIVCDSRRNALREPGDFTFPSRLEAAKGEREYVREQLIKRLAAHVRPTAPPNGLDVPF
ncbi:hypothetical protein [Pseudomonas syringae]|uniref:hypothetical protein n=1 Tax=Pseudomonas syringae TaxID=317 RepID=UPI001F25F3BC|nr:hypothetical protein [Pseudomonas syringae]MCF5372019.1 hypothetical protein [Pseudomonas syringae]